MPDEWFSGFDGLGSSFWMFLSMSSSIGWRPGDCGGPISKVNAFLLNKNTVAYYPVGRNHLGMGESISTIRNNT